jgi:hypothetical protein
MRRFPLLLLAAPILSITLPATAQNLLGNPDFTSNISGWTPAGSGTSTPNGTVGSPAPGSAQLDLDDPSGNTLTQAVQRCVTITPGRTYAISGRGRIGAVTSGGSNIFILVQFFENVGCTGASTSTIATQGASVPGTPGDFVEHTSGQIVATATQDSARFTAQVQTGGPGSIQGWVDHLVLIEDAIFKDGFQ